MPANPLSAKILLEIVGKQIPSKKNRHYCSKARLGQRTRVLLDEKIKARLEAITRDFVFQLLSGSATTEHTTLTECSRLSLIVSLLPEDDCWTWVPEQHIRCERVPKGQEGCQIVIEQL